jgi:hypothetical protein
VNGLAPTRRQPGHVYAAVAEAEADIVLFDGLIP